MNFFLFEFASFSDATLSLCLFRVYGSGAAQFLYVAPLLNYFGGQNNVDIPGYSNPFVLCFANVKRSHLCWMLFARRLTVL